MQLDVCGHPLHALSFLSLEAIIVTGIYGYTCRNVVGRRSKRLWLWLHDLASLGVNTIQIVVDFDFFLLNLLALQLSTTSDTDFRISLESVFDTLRHEEPTVNIDYTLLVNSI